MAALQFLSCVLGQIGGFVPQEHELKFTYSWMHSFHRQVWKCCHRPKPSPPCVREEPSSVEWCAKWRAGDSVIFLSLPSSIRFKEQISAGPFVYSQCLTVSEHVFKSLLLLSCFFFFFYSSEASIKEPATYKNSAQVFFCIVSKHVRLVALSGD